MTAGTVPVITVDGPSGSGKGTVSRRLAKALGFGFLDSGALYRALALAAHDQAVALDDAKSLSALAKNMDLSFGADETPQVFLDGRDVTDRLHEETNGNRASKLAPLVEVRAALLDRQRGFRLPPGLVADGRDMGSVVFPEAVCKIYLTATAAVRAARRHKQLREKGISVSIEGLTREIEERDRRDRERPISPLVVPEGALVLDSSELTIEAVVDTLLNFVRDRL